MKVDKFSQPIFEDQDIFKFLYENDLDTLDQLIAESSPEVEKLIQTSGLSILTTNNIEYTQEVEDFDKANQNNWFMPDEYKNMDIEKFLIDVCPVENYNRLMDELVAYKQRDMYNLLCWLKYFVDTCRKTNVVWGVGRGSSVASYVLYLIGVHRIDSIKYNLDWREFLR
jgi:DNA polymerase III alpha subunit